MSRAPWNTIATYWRLVAASIRTTGRTRTAKNGTRDYFRTELRDALRVDARYVNTRRTHSVMIWRLEEAEVCVSFLWSCWEAFSQPGPIKNTPAAQFLRTPSSQFSPWVIGNFGIIWANEAPRTRIISWGYCAHKKPMMDIWRGPVSKWRICVVFNA